MVVDNFGVLGGCTDGYVLDIQCFNIVKNWFLPFFAPRGRFLCFFEGLREVLQGCFSDGAKFFS